VLLVAGQAADIGVRMRDDEPYTVGGGAGNGDVPGVLEVDELTGERREARQGRGEGRPKGLDNGVEGRHVRTLEEQDVLQHWEDDPQYLHRVELDRLRWQRGCCRHIDVARVDYPHGRHGTSLDDQS
jgi:hypothetical protein